MNIFKIALVQTKIHDEKEKNLKNARLSIERAGDLGADIVCFPELFLTKYFCQSENPDCFDLSEPIPGPSTKKLCAEAKRKRVSLICPLFEKRAPGIYHNSLVVISPAGEISGVYRKMHIPDDPGWFEKFYFTPGDAGFPCFETGFAKIAALICWDQWFPEAARIVSLKGAQIIFYPTAIGWRSDEEEHLKKTQIEAWKTVQRAHAISNGIYVAAVNRVGFEESGDSGGEGTNFWGNSFACDPAGEIISEASGDDEQLAVAEIDLRKLEETRRNWPFLRDRRIDAYAGLLRRFIDDTSEK